MHMHHGYVSLVQWCRQAGLWFAPVDSFDHNHSLQLKQGAEWGEINTKEGQQVAGQNQVAETAPYYQGPARCVPVRPAQQWEQGRPTGPVWLALKNCGNGTSCCFDRRRRSCGGGGGGYARLSQSSAQIQYTTCPHTRASPAAERLVNDASHSSEQTQHAPGVQAGMAHDPTRSAPTVRPGHPNQLQWHSSSLFFGLTQACSKQGSQNSSWKAGIGLT